MVVMLWLICMETRKERERGEREREREIVMTLNKCVFLDTGERRDSVSL